MAANLKGGPFFVVELVEGNYLASLLQRHGPFPSGAALEIMLQGALGLHCLFSNGVLAKEARC